MPTTAPSWIPLNNRLKKVLAESGVAETMDGGWERWSEPQLNAESVAYFIATVDTQATAMQRAAETAMHLGEEGRYSCPGFWSTADWLINYLAPLLNLSRPLIQIADEHMDGFARPAVAADHAGHPEETRFQPQAARVMELCHSVRKLVLRFVRGDLRGRPELLLEILLYASRLLTATIALRMIGLGPGAPLNGDE